MVLASTGGAPQNGCHQRLHPHGQSLLPPGSPGGSSRSASGSDPGTFQITASAWGLGACEILCAPFKSRICLFSHPVLLNVSPTGFQTQTFWGTCQCRPPGLGSLMWGLVPSLLGEELYDCNYPLICGLLTQGCGS